MTPMTVVTAVHLAAVDFGKGTESNPVCLSPKKRGAKPSPGKPEHPLCRSTCPGEPAIAPEASALSGMHPRHLRPLAKHRLLPEARPALPARPCLVGRPGYDKRVSARALASRPTALPLPPNQVKR